MRQFIRLLAVGLTIVVVGVALPTPAGASVPPTGVKLAWHNLATGYCLGVAGGDVTSGKAIIVWRCNGNPDQSWTSEPVPGTGEVLLRNNKKPSMCLSVGNMSLDVNARLVIWDCKEPAINADQRWVINNTRHPTCDALLNVNSGLVMAEPNPNEGAPVVQRQSGGFTDEWWCGDPA